MYQSNIEKTAFYTEWGKYEYLYMPFRLCNAPSTLQRLIDLVLTELLHCARLTHSQRCQTQILSGPKLKTGTKLRAKLDIY